MRWQIQEAKARFSRLVQCALSDGPQVITRHGEEAVVVIAAEEYRRLKRRTTSFKKFLRSAPMEGIEIVRSRDTGREVDL